MASALWLVAWWRSGLAMLEDPRTFVHGAGGVVNPDSSSRVSALGIGLMGGPILLYFLSLVSVPLIPRLVPMFVPKKRSQQGVVDSRAVTTPKLALIGQLHIM